MARKRPSGRVNATGRSTNIPRFVMLHHYVIDSPAYRSLSCTARSLLIEVWRRHNGRNNGHISFSIREAAEGAGVSNGTAVKALRELEDRGFLKARQRGSFHLKIRHATEWTLTGEDFNNQPATKDFMRWGTQKNKTR